MWSHPQNMQNSLRIYVSIISALTNEKRSPFSYYTSHSMECAGVKSCNVRKVSEIRKLISKWNFIPSAYSYRMSLYLFSHLVNTHSVPGRILGVIVWRAQPLLLWCTRSRRKGRPMNIGICDSGWWVTGRWQGQVSWARVGGVYGGFPRQGFIPQVCSEGSESAIGEGDRWQSFSEVQSQPRKVKNILEGVAFSEQCCSPSRNVKLSKRMFSAFNIFIFHEEKS